MLMEEPTDDAVTGFRHDLKKIKNCTLITKKLCYLPFRNK